MYLRPFRTAVPFWGQTSQKISKLSPKRDWGSKGVRSYLVFNMAPRNRNIPSYNDISLFLVRCVLSRPFLVNWSKNGKTAACRSSCGGLRARCGLFFVIYQVYLVLIVVKNVPVIWGNASAGAHVNRTCVCVQIPGSDSKKKQKKKRENIWTCERKHVEHCTRYS